MRNSSGMCDSSYQGGLLCLFWQSQRDLIEEDFIDGDQNGEDGSE